MISLCLLLSACSHSGMSADKMAKEIRSEILDAGNIRMTLNITADYGDNVYDFKLHFEGGTDGGTLTVLEPETIAGLTAVFTADGLTFQYDGASLDTGELNESGLSPIGSLPAMLTQWCEGYISQSTYETMDGLSCTAVSFSVSDDTQLRTWFDCETYLPVRSELTSSGSVVIFCEFENVIIE